MKVAACVLLAIVAGVSGECNIDEMLGCVTSMTDVVTASPSDVAALCNALDEFDACVSRAGCEAESAQYQSSVEAVRSQCDAVVGDGSEGSCSLIDALPCAQSVGNAMTSADDKDEVCSAFASFNDCLAKVSCSVDDFLKLDASLEEQMNEIKKQCSGAGRATMSMLIMAAMMFLFAL